MGWGRGAVCVRWTAGTHPTTQQVLHQHRHQWQRILENSGEGVRGVGGGGGGDTVPHYISKERKKKGRRIRKEKKKEKKRKKRKKAVSCRLNLTFN